MHDTNNFRLLTESKVDVNTSTKASVPTDAEWGLDTVNLSFAVTPDLCESDTSQWTSESSRYWSDSSRTNSQVEWNYETEYATVKVILYVDKERCSLRFNAARLLSPKSRQLLPPPALKALVAGLLEDIRSHVWPAFDKVTEEGEIIRDEDWAQQVTVTRLDVARNFLIDDVYALKSALVQAKPNYGKTSHLYWDSKGGWTLSNDTGRSGKDRIYDKSAELAGYKADETFSENGNWFRFEAQLQKKRLINLGLKTLATIDDESVWFAIQYRWKACNWGVSLPEPGTLGELLATIPTQAIKSGVLLVLAASSLGLTHLFTQSKMKTYSAVARKLGLNIGQPLSEVGVPSRQLDLEEGAIKAA